MISGLRIALISKYNAAQSLLVVLQTSDPAPTVLYSTTESYDNLLPVGQDERWDIFKSFHTDLEDSFPLIYSNLESTTVNTYDLVFHWQGSNDSLKPLLLTAHQDVVPVDWSNEDRWIHRPYSGHYDGTWIWGRGNHTVIVSLTYYYRITVNSLLGAGFNPQRTIVLAFGFDEEASGTEGAGQLAVYLEGRYGMNAFAMILDEGEGYTENVKQGAIFALPGVSEKGYFDASIKVSTPGGHSSVLPDHTSIGLLSLLIVSLESNPHLPRLTRNGTAFAAAQCAVAHAPEGKFPPVMKTLARRAMNPHDEIALKKFGDVLFEAVPFFSVLSRTTQAVDLISGGVKVNALPERAEALVNHRIADSTSEIKNHITDLVLFFGAQHNLSIHGFGVDVRHGSEIGKIVLSEAFYSALEPSPLTPIANNHMYDVLSGTIKATLQSSSRYEAANVVLTPSLGLDTRFCWNLTENIFRYSHRGDRNAVYSGVHTTNEAIRGESFIEDIRFFTRYTQFR
ncbi:Zn-dependent exopeptidase [Lentinula aciculospora]|uniref:Zn-dependent exopeptidase n=1 Tax=Lentinula aciculospora TaxID=153920 RepID=A0A9W9A5A4_9AGAR|nr:Zn-dependent exopeptidase [Lentinula aciculospora]